MKNGIDCRMRSQSERRGGKGMKIVNVTLQTEIIPQKWYNYRKFVINT